MIDKKDIEYIREKVSLLEIVQECDISMSHAGSNTYKGLCPMPTHNEKTASFNVTPDTNRYYCFGCGENGDVFDFLRDVKGQTFTESIEYLAEKIGYKVTHTDGKAQKKTDAPLSEINAAASEFFSAQPNDEVTEFFKSRNLDEEMLRKEWGVGYSAKGLLPYLKNKGYSENHIIEAGLARRSERGSVYEVFQRRLMWTIHDHLNRTVGFGARQIYENDPMPGKFINTSQTEIYKKHDLLFGLDKARTGIRKESLAILTEGYTDVVAFHISDLPYAVASCGTSVTENQIRRLARLIGENGELVVAMDGDAAGLKSAAKLVDLASEYPMSLTCLLFPDKLDPEEYHRHHGEQGLRDLFEQRRPLVETLLEKTLKSYDLTKPEQVAQATIESGKVLENVHNPILCEQYDRWIAQRLRVSAEHVSNSYEEKKVRKQTGPVSLSGLEYDVLRMSYQKPAVFREYLDKLGENPDFFRGTDIKNALEEMMWMDMDCDDAEWREALIFSFPELESSMKTGLPYEVVNSDKTAGVFMKELVERLENDCIKRRNKERMKKEIFQNASSVGEIMRRLANQTNGANV